MINRPIMFNGKITLNYELELIGIPHNILKHSEMPRAVFYLIWQGLLSGKPISGVVKDSMKKGRYYWVIVDFKPKFDTHRNIIALRAFRRVASQTVIDNALELYVTMLAIEKKHGMEKSLSLLDGFLEEQDFLFEEFIEELVKPKGIITSLLKVFKKLID